MNWLQSVENAIASLVIGIRRSDHTTPVLHQLHLLTVRQRPLLIFAIVPSRLVTDAREQRLRSTASRTCIVMWTCSTFGNRAFAAARLDFGTIATEEMDLGLSYNRFLWSLKTFLFG